MSAFIITCPNCKTQFEPGDSIREEVEKELRNKMMDWQKKKDDEFKIKEISYQQQLQVKEEEINSRIRDEKQKIQKELQDSLTKSIAGDYENQMKILQQAAIESE